MTMLKVLEISHLILAAKIVHLARHSTKQSKEQLFLISIRQWITRAKKRQTTTTTTTINCNKNYIHPPDTLKWVSKWWIVVNVRYRPQREFYGSQDLNQMPASMCHFGWEDDSERESESNVCFWQQKIIRSIWNFILLLFVWLVGEEGANVCSQMGHQDEIEHTNICQQPLRDNSACLCSQKEKGVCCWLNKGHACFSCAYDELKPKKKEMRKDWETSALIRCSQIKCCLGFTPVTLKLSFA